MALSPLQDLEGSLPELPIQSLRWINLLVLSKPTTIRLLRIAEQSMRLRREDKEAEEK